MDPRLLKTVFDSKFAVENSVFEMFFCSKIINCVSFFDYGLSDVIVKGKLFQILIITIMIMKAYIVGCQMIFPFKVFTSFILCKFMLFQVYQVLDKHKATVIKVKSSLYQMSHVMRKPTFCFPTWSDTNQAVQLQKIARGLKFRG